MSKWVENYVKGCAKCQQNKTLTHWTTTPPYKINIPPLAQLFEVIAMDLITQLPNSNGHDTILTIIDHGCTRVALFLPCTTNVTGEGIAKLSPPAPAPVKRMTGGMGKSWKPAPRSDYQFCQYISPSLTHDSGPCNCMMSPSPFGPFR